VSASGHPDRSGGAIAADRVIVPATLEEALSVRAVGACRPIAGGTDLVVRNRRGADVPVALDAPPLFIGMLPELRRIDTAGTIGAAVTLAELERSPLCPAPFKPVLPEFASPAVCTLATIGGNICNASPAADLLPPLHAHDAVLEIASSAGRRQVPIADFVTGPGTTTLRSNELLVAVHIGAAGTDPARTDPDYVFYRKVAARRSNALSKLSIYVAAWTGAGRLTRIAIALGAVAPTVIRLPVVESALTQGAAGPGESAAPIGVDATALVNRAPVAIDAYASVVRPIDDQRSSAIYRRDTVLRLLRFVLTDDLPRHLRTQSREDQ